MSDGGWTTIRVRDFHDRSAVIHALFAAGADGVQELDAEVVTSLRDPDLEGLARSIAYELEEVWPHPAASAKE